MAIVKIGRLIRYFADQSGPATHAFYLLSRGLIHHISHPSTSTKYGKEEYRFFLIIFLHFSGIKKIKKVTCCGIASEGVGCQALLLLDTIVFARRYGFNYVHTPFNEIAHADRAMKEWVRAWENFLNFGLGENTEAANDFWTLEFSRNCTFILKYFDFQLCENFSQFFLDEIKQKYFLNKKVQTCPGICVAIHIRRGDVNELDTPWMWTPIASVRNCICEFISLMEDLKLKYEISVFSEGLPEDFRDLEGLPNLHLYLNADPIWTFWELTRSDVFLTAKSCFSYLAALLSDGIIITQPLSNRSVLKDWIVCNEDGTINSDYRGIISRRLDETKKIAS